MTQIAKVISTDGKFALVEVSRKTVCEGCHNMASGSKNCSACLSFGDKHAQAKAYNTIGAGIGDRVVVSASSKKVIAYSAAVFFLPIAIAFIVYFLTIGRFGENALLFTLAAFVLTFAVSCIVLEKTVKRNPDLEITGYATESEKEESEE